MTEQQKNTTALTVQNQMELALNIEIKKFDFLTRVAEMWSKSEMIPKIFQGNPGSCMIALSMAEQLQMSPFMVMQNMYVVHGKPGFQAQLVIALINRSKIFTPLEWEFTGEGDSLVCRCFATNNETGKVAECLLPYKLAIAEGWVKSNPKWSSMKRQMLKYRSGTFFMRTYCPEVLMGMRTTDELRDDVVEAEVLVAEPRPRKKAKTDINKKLAEIENTTEVIVPEKVVEVEDIP